MQSSPGRASSACVEPHARHHLLPGVAREIQRELRGQRQIEDLLPQTRVRWRHREGCRHAAKGSAMVRHHTAAALAGPEVGLEGCEVALLQRTQGVGLGRLTHSDLRHVHHHKVYAFRTHTDGGPSEEPGGP